MRGRLVYGTGSANFRMGFKGLKGEEEHLGNREES